MGCCFHFFVFDRPTGVPISIIPMKRRRLKITGLQNYEGKYQSGGVSWISFDFGTCVCKFFHYFLTLAKKNI